MSKTKAMRGFHSYRLKARGSPRIHLQQVVAGFPRETIRTKLKARNAKKIYCFVVNMLFAFLAAKCCLFFTGIFGAIVVHASLAPLPQQLPHAAVTGGFCVLHALLCVGI